jgi:V/A-type H+-transporting ATPase subunit I
MVWGKEYLFRTTPMKRLYAAVPITFEDNLLKALGELGTIQLVSDYTVKGFKKIENVDRVEKYVKLQQRMISVLSSIPPEKTKNAGFLQSLKRTFSAPVRDHTSAKADLMGIEGYVADLEARLDIQLVALESLHGDIERLKNLKERLLILQKHQLRIDHLGDFRHIFVKAGLMQRELTPRLGRYTEGTSVAFTSFPESRKEDFLVITGLNDDKAHIENALPVLNFSELTFPSDIKPDPNEALFDVSTAIQQKTKEAEEIENTIREIGRKFREESKIYEPSVSGTLRMEEARSSLSRTGKMSLIHGWVPADRAKEATDTVLEATSGAAFVKLEDPGPQDNPPVKMENKGPLKSFELLTKLRGTPNYREIDPTPIMAVLFSVMFGLMFGDIGNGLVLTIIGVILSKLQKDFLRIPASAVQKLGGIIIACGISSMCFGALFGEAFLLEGLINPILFSPFRNQSAIIGVVLVFGVLQIALGLVMKIVNMIRKGDRYKAVFTGITLLYYILGVLLAVKFISNMSFSVFTENIGLTVSAVSLLALIFFFPIIEGLLEGELKVIEQLLKGVAEFIETFLSFLTNSISYVRLAAFAIAHGALGMSAHILASTVGMPVSYVIMNFLVIAIEGLAILIQSMRLTYYEFFTKFYAGGGLPYRPFKLPPIFT